jgi:hypothetical protein
LNLFIVNQNDSLKTGGRLTKEAGADMTPIPDGGSPTELEILRRRVLEEELRRYKEKSELLIDYMNEAIGVVQKLAG